MYSRSSEPVRFERDCDAVMVPQGESVTLPAGKAWMRYVFTPAGHGRLSLDLLSRPGLAWATSAHLSGGAKPGSRHYLFGGTTHHPGADDSPVEAPMTLELDYDPRTQRFTGTSTEGGGAPRPVCLAPVVPPPER